MPKRRSFPTLNFSALAIGVIVVAIVVVIVVAVVGAGRANFQGQSVPNVANTSVEVLITAQDIEEGTELKPALFRKESRPSKDYSTGSAVTNFEQLRGSYAASFIPAGQSVLIDHLTTRAPVNSVVPRIRPGFRAITIELDKQTTNEGWARSGVRVDVLLATSQGNRPAAMVIAQNLRVLSCGTSVSSEFGGDSKLTQNGASTVTLEVSAEDQKRLKLAAGRGELRLLLRGDDDTDFVRDGLRIGIEGVIPIATDRPKAPTDQGWVMIDGKKYIVKGEELVPG
jgi:Flp pilus assembly protein CpaB